MAKKKGLWSNIHAKRKRGESPAKKGDKNYPETLDIGEGMKTARKNVGADTCWDGYKAKGTKKKDGKEVPNCVKEGKTFAEFCAEGKSRIETDSDYRKRFKALADNFAEKRKEQTSAKKTRKESVEILDVDGNMVAEITDLISPEPMTGWKQQNEDWSKKNKGDKVDGMGKDSIKAYRRENPGSKLQGAVTGNPKKGSKDADRRKNYCDRSKGQQDMHNIDCSSTPDKPICKARKRWKC